MLRFILPSLMVLAASASTPVPLGAEDGGRAGGDRGSPTRPQTDGEDMLIHRLRPGETPQSIASAALRPPATLADVLALNGIAASQKLPVGFPLRLKAGWLRHEPLAAEVVAFTGPSLIMIGGSSTEVALGMSLTEGDRIRTSANGFVTLKLGDGSKIALPSNSDVTIERLRRLPLTGVVDRRFRLDEGKVDAKVTPLKPDGSRFLITTPVSVAAVRGTRYRVGFTPAAAQATVGVIEGRVAVAQGGRETAGGGLLVAAGQGAAVTRTMVLPPVALAPAPRIEQIAPTAGSVAVRFAPLPNINRYRVTFSTDEDGLELLAAVETGTTAVTRDGLPAGRVFVQVAAVDEQGLAGMPTNTSYRQPGTDGVASSGVTPVESDPDTPGPIEEGSAFDDAPAAGDGATGLMFGADPMAGMAAADEPGGPALGFVSASAGLSGAATGYGDTVGFGGFGGAGGFGAGGFGGGGFLGGGGGGFGGGVGNAGGNGPIGGDPGPGGNSGAGNGSVGNGGVGNGGAGNGGAVIPGGTTAVPEPATWVMLVSGFGLLGCAVRRRRRREERLQPRVLD